MRKSFVAVTIACLGPILVSVGAQTPSPSSDTSASEGGIAEENSDGAKRCDCPPSPDGKFAFIVSFGEQDSSGDRLQIIDLIEKKSEKKMQRIDDASMLVFWNVLWAPDSNGFALKTKVEGHPRLQGVAVYFRSGETFQKVELSNLPNGCTTMEVVWAPDSKRFAINYMITWIHYETVAFYQLRGDKWVALRSPVDGASEHTQLAQLASKYSPKNTYPKGHSSSVSDSLEARSWADADSLLLYADSGSEEDEAAALFTLKFDDAGNWKIVKMHRMSDKEIEKEEAGENVSGPAQTTDPKGLSADASFRDADRHLNEVYNALRARLSPSERDGLKKEQLAWLGRRTGAVQVAKENAQENSAEPEATKMTQARAAELEKRLKKAK